MTDEELVKFLEEEEAKLERADMLLAKLESYWFGPLDPRYWHTERELRAVTKSFRMSPYDPVR